ncbi:ring-1,2-phenylacetyl-CoA epoxidase subunit PaaC [Agrococcus baldri]|uniref:Ring-1,2-phenylacetyl-CoA epoxidase subunit PaaC n=1 Tax=Agrococcus baldri TaxID=153730 RepID=A0AA94HLY6_9MICO|nr:ring-1,2-phenylacetyl-CoA epoxidase subunit PaaC [Agrococcus baldri]
MNAQLNDAELTAEPQPVDPSDAAQPKQRDAAAVNAEYDAEAADVHGEVTVDELDLAAELSGVPSAKATADIAEYALRLGDDALILSQRLGWWISRAPELEEDMALGNIALDLLGHARSLLHYAGSATGKSEDDLAYFRDEHEFRCAWLFEQPNGDFAHTTVRGLIAAIWMQELYTALSQSTDASLAAIAAKSVKEVAYHRDHAVQWTLRLAGGTEESRRRLLEGLTDLWTYTDELFRDDELHDRLDGIAPRPSSLRAGYDEIWNAVLAEAEIEPADYVGRKIGSSSGGGRHGNHSTHLGPLLAEMQVLARRHPGATW